MWEFEKLIEHVQASIQQGVDANLAALTKKYNMNIMNIVSTQWINSNCSAIIFINYTPLSVLTNGNIQVNNYILQPGGFFGVGGNNNEIDTTQYNVVFGSAATNCVVIKKLYV